MLSEAEANALPDALLASNTSTLPITGLAEGVQRPADVVGMHFFSPVDKMPLVELIVGERTSDAALARAYDVVRQIGKTPIVVQDSRGFFTSRVFGTLVLEGAALLAEGLAPMSIERAALQAGFPAGPLTLLDEVTLTLPLKISDEAKKAGSAEDHPGLAVVRALVEQGRTGKAAGKGFFDWAPEKRVWPGLAELYPPHDGRPVRRRPGAAAVRDGRGDGALRRGAGADQRRGRQHRLDHGHRLPAALRRRAAVRRPVRGRGGRLRGPRRRAGRPLRRAVPPAGAAAGAGGSGREPARRGRG